MYVVTQNKYFDVHVPPLTKQSKHEKKWKIQTVRKTCRIVHEWRNDAISYGFFNLYINFYCVAIFRYHVGRAGIRRAAEVKFSQSLADICIVQRVGISAFYFLGSWQPAFISPVSLCFPSPYNSPLNHVSLHFKQVQLQNSTILFLIPCVIK